MDTFSTVVVAMSSTNESSAAVDGAAKLMGFVLHLGFILFHYLLRCVMKWAYEGNRIKP